MARGPCRRVALTMLLLVVIARHAAVAQPEPRPLSLEEALSLGEAEHPLTRQARAATDVEHSRRVGAGLILPTNPWASVLVAARPEPEARGAQVYVHVEQSVEIAGQRGTRLRAVDGAVRMARLRESFAVAEARAQVRIAYAAALLAEALVKEARSREQLADQLSQSARIRFEGGAVSEVDLRLAEAERSKVVVERIEAEAAERRELAELRRLTGLPRDLPLRLTSAMPWPIGELQALETLIRSAKDQRRDLAAIKAGRGYLDLEIARLHREAVPNPALFMEVWRDFGSLVIGGGLAIPIPIVRRNQGDVAIARAEQHRGDVDLLLLDRLVADEVTLAYRSVETRRQEVEEYQRTLVPSLEKQLELVTDGWRAGKFDLFRVMAASRDLRDARRAHLQLLGSLWQAVVELDRAAGRP